MAVYAHRGERKEPRYSIEGSSSKTRYSYAKPAEKAQHGKPAELGTDIDRYKLPAIDVQTTRRNYPGYAENQYFSLEDIRGGDISGSTETDSVTHPQGSGGYTKINQKSGPKSRWPNVRS